MAPGYSESLPSRSRAGKPAGSIAFGQQQPSPATRDFHGVNQSYLDNEEEGLLFAGSNAQVFPR
ncbi:hypothetical protein C8J56DRAFT_1059703 [Mycena floridula]|nr:hypothetical protein C8J56DRAFT_1059703 [Mycena floridula]